MNLPRIVLLPVLPLAFAFVLEAFPAGEPSALWVAQSQGIAKVQDGVVALEIPSAMAVEAIAVDAKHQRVWAYAGKRLASYDFDGHILSSTPIDAPAGNPVFLAVDVRSDRVWLAVHAQLLLFDAQGFPLRNVRLPNPVAAVTIDAKRSHLWVAHKATLQVHDASGERLAVLDTPEIRVAHALAYDARLDQVWVAADNTLRRFAPNGTQVFRTPLELVGAVTALAADQDGSVWITDSRQVMRLNSAGGVDFAVAPALEALGPFVVSMAADPRDHTAWIATQRRINQYDAGGAQLADFPLHDGDPSRLVRQLALPAGPVAPQLEFVAPASGSALNVSRPTFEFRYSGENVDASSLALTANAAPLAASCVAQAGQGACTVLEILVDGTYDIAATIADAEGNVSEPVLVRITIDTLAPAVTVTSPADGALTNVTSVLIEGALSEAAELTVNGASVAVAERRFSHSVALAEGRNDVLLRAVDAAGNVAAKSLYVVLDTVPPTAPVAGAITARAGAGQVTVTGSAGSVEGGTWVTLVNARTGERVMVVANGDGSFSATLAGEAGDLIQAYATDGATNQGGTTGVIAAGGPFSGTISFGSSSPANGVSVTGDRILVSVDLTAPPNTGVTVNDVVAVGVPSGSALRFHAEVPLVTGSNTLTIKAHGQDGRVVAKTLSVTSRGPFPYRIMADRSAGVAPLAPRLEVWDQSGRGIRQVQVDVDANGSIDKVLNPGDPIDLSYTGTGLRQARVVVIDNTLQAHEQRVSFVLMDLASVDRSIQAVWGAMNDALAAGDKETAMGFLSGQAQEQYGPVFDALMPRMPEIVASYSEPKRSLVMAGYAEYGVNRVVAGRNKVFLIGFTTTEAGQWRLDSM